jgi:menaquinone-specific isochorismate synthase
MTSVATPFPTLRAVTRPFDPPADLLEARAPDGFAWLHDHAGFVTSGVAARVDVDEVEVALAGVDVDDPLVWPGTGPLAVGALAFDGRRASSLVIPRVVVGRDAAGRGWVTEIGDEPARLRVPVAAEEPTRWQVDSRTDRRRWQTMVGAALHAIERGELDKVVLARAVHIEADVDFAVSGVLARLRERQPGCFVHSVDGLIGASPELLVRRVGTGVESRPLAGTVRAGNGASAALRGSTKDIHEHRLVVDGVVDALAPACVELAVPDEPSAVSFSSVVHLATLVRGSLREPALSALSLARQLHPTAAVAGSPCAAALDVIADLELEDRGRYAAPVGWVDGRGDGEWAVALRGAELEGRRAVLWAGAGIVAGSEPDAEWAETQAKLEPMLHTLVCP